jgi:hypothetical protein
MDGDLWLDPRHAGGTVATLRLSRAPAGCAGEASA